jgi:hypothetical protein
MNVKPLIDNFLFFSRRRKYEKSGNYSWMNTKRIGWQGFTIRFLGGKELCSLLDT